MDEPAKGRDPDQLLAESFRMLAEDVRKQEAMLFGIYDVLNAMAVKQFGQSLCVVLRDADGNVTKLTPRPNAVLLTPALETGSVVEL